MKKPTWKHDDAFAIIVHIIERAAPDWVSGDVIEQELLRDKEAKPMIRRAAKQQNWPAGAGLKWVMYMVAAQMVAWYGARYTRRNTPWMEGIKRKRRGSGQYLYRKAK